MSSTARVRVGRYNLGRTLGEGTFAKVKLARNVETGENVAIKILDKEKVLSNRMVGQDPGTVALSFLKNTPSVRTCQTKYRVQSCYRVTAPYSRRE